MDLSAINRAISLVCSEMQPCISVPKQWDLLSEEDLFHEAVVCIFSSQTVFEIALAVANHVREQGFMDSANILTSLYTYEHRLCKVLENTVPITFRGQSRQAALRFKKRSAGHVTATVRSIYGSGHTFKKILREAPSACTARTMLIKNVTGFGPKQASMFLRSIGFSNELAILDTHVLDYMRIARDMLIQKTTLSKLSRYQQLEAEFKHIASGFGYPVGCVDLAIWVTIRVAKQERYL